MESLQVCDYMNHRPVRLTIDVPVAEAVERLLNSGQSGGAVIDDRGRLVGFLSEQDCIAQMIESCYYREQVCRVKDIMQAPALSVKPYMSVIELAQQLIKNNMPRVYPVVDDDGVLVGSINRAAVLKAIDKQLRAGYQAVS
ncbi:CBS domain-containing protein [Alteromonas lipotrueiana]|uniref:CBS domain-containing protein n=1 Tax=Alteromonas lipotrueiana TaxID=2803815 RepID=UPI001C447A33|nr:CBS domain-containing protein [Alteromonas lipotrueiana]